MIGLEQPVERQQSRQQRRHPDDPGADAPQHRRLRADAERKQHDREHKKAEHEAGIAALAQGEAQIAPEEAEKRRHRSAGSGIGRQRREGVERESGGSVDVDRRVGRDDDPAAGGAMLGDRALEPRSALSSVERARRLVEQPDRRRRRDQPGEREPPALAGGKPAARPVGNRVERKCRQRRLDSRRAAGELRRPAAPPRTPRFRAASSPA